MTRWLTCIALLWFALAGAPFAQDAMNTAIDGHEATVESGPVTARVSLTPKAPTFGDQLTLTLEVTAAADVSVNLPVFGQSLDRFQIIDFTPRETVDANGQTVLTQRYTLLAPFSGEQSIPPLIIEFVDLRAGQRRAPEGEDAYEILTDRLPFTVTSALPSAADVDLKPARGELPPLAKPGTTRNITLGAVVLAAVVAVALFGWLRRWRTHQSQQTAYEVAKARLEHLRASPTPTGDSVDPYFVELTTIVRQYLEAQFDLRAPELTTEEFLDVASGSPDLTDAHRGFLVEFLRNADRVKFAGHVPDAATISDALTSVENFLEQTRSENPGGEQPAHA